MRKADSVGTFSRIRALVNSVIDVLAAVLYYLLIISSRLIEGIGLACRALSELSTKLTASLELEDVAQEAIYIVKWKA